MSHCLHHSLVTLRLASSHRPRRPISLSVLRGQEHAANPREVETSPSSFDFGEKFRKSFTVQRLDSKVKVTSSLISAWSFLTCVITHGSRRRDKAPYPNRRGKLQCRKSWKRRITPTAVFSRQHITTMSLEWLLPAVQVKKKHLPKQTARLGKRHVSNLRLAPCWCSCNFLDRFDKHLVCPNICAGSGGVAGASAPLVLLMSYQIRRGWCGGGQEELKSMAGWHLK